MKKVLVLRGLPASGKSTYAKNLIRDEYAGRAIRINNDDLTGMMFAGVDMFGADGVPEFLNSVRVDLLGTALSQPWVDLVIVDNTNLNTRTVKSLWEVAVKHGAEFEVDDQFLAVGVRECVARDAGRLYPVGEAVILKMARQAEKLKPWNPPYALPEIAPYHNDNADGKSCVIVDIDGTLAHMDGRDPYDYSRVMSDRVDPQVRDYIQRVAFEHRIIVMSGREDNCLNVTVEWLRANDVPFHEIHMRHSGDYRPDWIVKNELFQEHVAEKYNVHLVLDDRDQVIDLWRRKLELPTWQVADGNF